MRMSNDKCTIVSTGDRLRHFKIEVESPMSFTQSNIIDKRYTGRAHGCGSKTNDMNTGETVSFTCHPWAEGYSLKITIVDRVEVLTLCEVFVYGKGMNWLVYVL